jgi:hypothetical protein
MEHKMRYLILLFPFLLFANSLTVEIINKIKEIDSFHKKFLPFPDYDVFNYKFHTTIQKPVILLNPITKKIQNCDISVQMIFNDKILVNNVWYKKGDELCGGVIYKITSQYVVIKKDKRFIKIPVFKNYIKGIK